MHIESQKARNCRSAKNCANTISYHRTKCSKMTEEATGNHNTNIRHGINGNANDCGTPTHKDQLQQPQDGAKNYVQGGRLKFFKDGKFILELERAREGERVSWVSVPRKTFWPPQGTAASTPSYRQESSTSLSVSDDNSSIQSSPWQRDHSWKQTQPRKNLSKELSLYFWRPKSKRSQNLPPFFWRTRKRCRRRPYINLPLENGTAANSNADGKENTDKVQAEKGQKRRKSLLTIIQSLNEKSARTSTPPRSEMVVSPRKRFLREMEKDKAPIEDANCQKRSRSKPQSSTASSPSLTSTKSVNGTDEGSTAGAAVSAVAKSARNCSYSITSLLADDRNSTRRSSPSVLASSPNHSPSHFAPVTTATTSSASSSVAPPQHHPQYCSPTTDDRWYSESVDKLRSIELSQVEKRSAYPPYAAPPHQPPYHHLPAYMFPFPVPPFFNATGIYGRGGYLVPPIFHTAPMPLPHHRPDRPSCSWTAEPSREVEHQTETVPDMPLNLSKHAG